MIRSFYSPEIKALGVIFLIFRDNRQTVAKANSTSPIPPMAINPSGTANVHCTIPIPFKNKAVKGLMIKLERINPAIVERIVVGINDNAVCRIS